MRTFVRTALLVATLVIFATQSLAQTQIRDVVYMKSGGAAFTLDVFKPKKPNRAAVVFLISGGWISDHNMVEPYNGPTNQSFLKAGFTVITVVHGAQPRFKVPEIVDQVQKSIMFIHGHAKAFGFDPNRMGVTGISSGGHLSLMAAGATGSPLRAVAAIAPPTDLNNWGNPSHLFTEESALSIFIPALGLDANAPPSEFGAIASKLSPINLVTPRFPRTLIVHGDADAIVPLQQATSMDAKLGAAKVEHKLEIIPGGGHDSPTFETAVKKVVGWFKSVLLN